MQICRRFALSPRAVCFGLVVGLASLLLAGCGQSTGPTAGVATPTWTPFVMPTPKPTNTPRPMGSLCSGPGDFQGPFQSPVATAGDLSFEAMSSAVMYPQLKLPDGQLLKPLQVGGAISSADTAHYPLANVTMYRLTVCNTSKTAAHTIASMNIKVNSFVAYASQLNVTQVCALVYSRQGTTGNGCGGAQGADLLLRATLGSSAVGTTAQVTADGLQSAPASCRSRGSVPASFPSAPWRACAATRSGSSSSRSS